MLTGCFLSSVLYIFSAFADAATKRAPIEDYIPCERGWFLFSDKCYKIGGKKKSGYVNWDTASERCKEDGGILATVYNKELNDFLAKFLILDAKSNAWIGLRHKANESTYIWQDETPYDFNYWEPTEPTIKSPADEKEDCVEMVFVSLKHQAQNGQWNDLPCNFHRPYICQTSKSKNPKKSPDPRFCPGTGEAWKYQESCYSLVSQKMSWQDAEDHCQEKFQGHLLMIADFTVDLFLDYILSNFNKEIWIGIKVQEKLQQKWSSGWFVAYSDWSKDQGDFVAGTCVLRYKSRVWTTSACSKKYSFVCEKSTVLPPHLPPPRPGAQCPDLPEDWRDLGGKYCYFFDTSRSLSWYEASFQCMRRGGFLASIHSEEETAVLQPFLKYTHEKVYIGLYRLAAQENVFVWSDGSHLDFTYWNVDTDEPNNEYEKCGELYTSTMRWNDVKCDETKGFICSVRKLSSNVTEIKAEAKCRIGISVQAAVGMGSCILLEAILLVLVVYRLRPCGERRVIHTEDPPIPTTRRPRYAQSQVTVKDESEYYEHMT